MWRAFNIRVTVWGGQPHGSFQAWVVTGSLWSQVGRKGQLAGQAHAKAFRTHPALDLRSCPLHGQAHPKCRKVTRLSQVWGKPHRSNRPPQWPGGRPGSCAWGVGASGGARAPAGENKAAAARCWHHGLSALGQKIIESASGLRQRPGVSKPWPSTMSEHKD